MPPRCSPGASQAGIVLIAGAPSVSDVELTLSRCSPNPSRQATRQRPTSNRGQRLIAHTVTLNSSAFDSAQCRRNWRSGRVERIEVVTLTGDGKHLARQITRPPEDQKLYSSLVKPREVEHNAQIYRAYRKEAERIERDATRTSVCGPTLS